MREARQILTRGPKSSRVAQTENRKSHRTPPREIPRFHAERKQNALSAFIMAERARNYELDNAFFCGCTEVLGASAGRGEGEGKASRPSINVATSFLRRRDLSLRAP